MNASKKDARKTAFFYGRKHIERKFLIKATGQTAWFVQRMHEPCSTTARQAEFLLPV
jgi:hypothetical protein